MASARELTAILNDQRIITLEEIIKQNSLLPPIAEPGSSSMQHQGLHGNRFASNMPGSRINNFAGPASKRK